MVHSFHYHLMSSIWSHLVFFTAIMALPLVHSTMPISTISASPTILPYPPISSQSPILSPDVTPLFPHPKGDSPSPSLEPDFPTIPSSPSPPNPDLMFGPGPSNGLGPSEAMPLSTSNVLGLLGRASTSWIVMCLSLNMFLFMQLF